MRVNGQQISSLLEDYLVLPRGEDKEPIVFKGVAIRDFDEFNKLCPVPEPPAYLGKGGKKHVDSKDPGYKQQIANYGVKKLAWMVITTLVDTEFASVDTENPSTWEKWSDEASEVLSSGEQQRLINFVLAVNGLDEKKVEAARADFLRGLSQESATE
jgi:hypothetical protein